jgi:hypothetical protein
MIKRIATLLVFGTLAVSVSGCDKCGDFLKPQGPFDPVSCKTSGPR